MGSQQQRPLILVSNDDGCQFNGIKTLIKVAKGYGDVVVVAPMQHQSGMGSAITVTQPLRAFLSFQAEGIKEYLVSGTPTDCVKLAFDKLLDGRTPNLVLSGINHGLNTGTCSLYSGTMGAVFEGCVHGVDSVAFSYDRHGPDANMAVCEPVLRQVIERVLASGLPGDVCLNVNIPRLEGEIRGIKATAACMGHWEKEYEQRVDPFGFPYYWLTGNYRCTQSKDDTTDLYWLERGWATATPCKVDQTHKQAIAQIADLLR